MPKSQKLFTDPKIATPPAKPWYVWFRYFNASTTKMVLIVRTGGANYKQFKPKERIAELKALQEALLFKLNQGWNPITNTYPILSQEQYEREQLQKMKFGAALDWALSKCIVSSATKRVYSNTVEYFKQAANDLMIIDPIKNIDRIKVMAMINHLRVKRKWSNHATNKYTGYLGAIMEQLIEWTVTDFNPAHKIKNLPVAETNKYEPYTEEEKKLIAETLFLYHYRFYVIFLIVYHTGIREKEVLALKIKDVDLANQLITIIPDLEAENSKTKKIRRVPINDHLLAYLRELELNKFPSSFYVFGSPYESGIGNRGKGVNHLDYFKPSPVQVKRDTITKYWNKVVIKGLGINKYMYAAKHTGANDKILAGIPIQALKELYGHTSELMTERYATKIKEIHRRDIMQKSPSFIINKPGIDMPGLQQKNNTKNT
jgi:integrase